MTQPWMDAAWSHIGVHETAGEKATPEIVGFFARSGHPEVTSDETAWCAAFVGACLADAGLKPSGSLLARSYLNYGTKLDEPKVGAIAVFKRTNDPAHGHVAFVTGWGDGQVRVLGGNQRDSVCEEAFGTANLLGYRWPPVPAVEVLSATPAPNPLHKSGTIWGSVGTAVAGAAVYIEQTFQTLLDTATKWADIAPVRATLGELKFDGRAISFGLLAGCVVLIVSRRVKASQEGKAG